MALNQQHGAATPAAEPARISVVVCACGKRAVFRLYIRNFCSELLRHRPRDTQHLDVRVSVPGPR
jgi:hypothetical protein